MTRPKPNNLTPIITRYGGYKFRSRLEARWAVFFDALGWKWLYEVEGFQLPSGWYLPDFYFPELDIYAEVKPYELTDKEMTLCREFSIEKNAGNDHEFDMLLLTGTPAKTSYKSLSNGDLFLDLIFIPRDEKYYPFFYSSDFNDSMFEETEKAIIKSLEADFFFQQTNRL